MEEKKYENELIELFNKIKKKPLNLKSIIKIVKKNLVILENV